MSTAATIADAPMKTQQDLVRALDTKDKVARRRAEKDLLQAAAGIKARKREQRIAKKAAAVAKIAARPALPITNLGLFPVRTRTRRGATTSQKTRHGRSKTSTPP